MSDAELKALYDAKVIRPMSDKAGLLEKPLEFGFVMGAPNAQECDLGVPSCCGAFTLSM